MIRPQPCRWFEVVVARDDAFIALEARAGAGTAEIEWHTRDSIAEITGRPDELLKRYAMLAQRYRPYWPAPATHREAEHQAPGDALAAAISGLTAWSVEAEPAVAAVQATEAQLAELALAESALAELAGSPIDFSLLGQARSGVAAALFALPRGIDVPQPEDLLVRAVDLVDERLLLSVGPTESIETMARAVAEASGRRARFPDWLAPTAQANLDLIGDQKRKLLAELSARRHALQELTRQHGIDALLADVARATWCFEHGGAIRFALAEAQSPGDVFARITGWTAEPQRLIEAVEASGARALLRLPPSSEWPKGVRPPLVLRNPWWARPFELFPRLVGMPGAGSADPSMLLAFAVPLMFGYMFGDVGQGLVIAAIGFALRRRFPIAKLFIAGGLGAAVFGLVFGCVFAVHAFPAWWKAPLDDPLAILALPLVGGAALLTVGLALNALEAWWRGEFRTWLTTDAGYVAAYLGILAGFLHRGGFVVAAIGAIVFCAGHAVHARRANAALTAIAELAERLMQILINTLSFARVGAFALAHAGLASAIVALMTASDNIVVKGLVLVLGNAIVLVLETMVVSIQTTRLVLFEFFTRFLVAEGRVFHPLPPPPSLSQESSR